MEQRNHARSSSHESPGCANKYDMLENRPIKPMTRMSANYPTLSPKISPKAGSDAIGRPTPSDLTPQPHQRKRSASPVTRAINFHEDSDSEVKEVKASELKVNDLNDLKAIKYLLKQAGQPKKSAKPLEGQHHSAHAQRAQQQYTPDKYRTPSRSSTGLSPGNAVTTRAPSSPNSTGHSPGHSGSLQTGVDQTDSLARAVRAAITTRDVRADDNAAGRKTTSSGCLSLNVQQLPLYLRTEKYGLFSKMSEQ